MTKADESPKPFKTIDNPAGGSINFYLRADKRVFSITDEHEIHEHYNTEEDFLPLIPHSEQQADSLEAALKLIDKS